MYGAAKVCQSVRRARREQYLWVTSKIGIVKYVWECVHAPVNGKGGKERQDRDGAVLGGSRPVSETIGK